MKKRVWSICIILTELINIIQVKTIRAEETEQITGEITFNGNEQAELMEPYLKKFEMRYPQVKVNYICLNDYENDMRRALEEGLYGDVFLVPSFFDTEMSLKYLEPLGDFGLLSQRYDFLEQSIKINEKIYSFPMSAYICGFLYNKDVFYQAGITELPKTTNEFLFAMENIRDTTDAIPFYSNYLNDWALSFWEYFPYIEMTGNVNYKDNQFIYEEDPYLEGTTHYQVYQLLYQLIESGCSEKDIEKIDWGQALQLFGEDKIGCLAIGSWAISQFKQSTKNPDAVGFMPFPNQIDGKQYSTLLTNYSIGISATSQNKKAARAFLDFMINESGYALEHEEISIVKTDPYPDALRDMPNVSFLLNAVGEKENYQKKAILSQKLNLSDTQEIKRLMESAYGLRDEDFDHIMQDWNTRWESSRTAKNGLYGYEYLLRRLLHKAT